MQSYPMERLFLIFHSEYYHCIGIIENDKTTINSLKFYVIFG